MFNQTRELDQLDRDKLLVLTIKKNKAIQNAKIHKLETIVTLNKNLNMAPLNKKIL